MAIKKVGDENETKLTVEIDNGDLGALKTIEQNYQFASKENLLRFAIAVLVKSGNKGIYVEDENGAKVRLLPNDLITIKRSVPPTQE